MSQPRPKRTIFDDAVDAELERWPGVTWQREHRSRHYALVLTFNGVSRFVTYATSPGDSIRGQQNHMRDVRGVLRDLGAVREREAKATAPRRQRNRTEPKIALVAPVSSAPPTDPFSKLVAFRKALVDQAPFVLPIKVEGKRWWRKWL